VTCNYVIIGYDNVTSDERDVKRLQAEFIVLDEASAIKTLSSARTRAIKEKLDAPWRMALTATPIDNRPDELFSIMEWVDPGVLGRGDLFDLAYIERNSYGDQTGYKNLRTLRNRLGDAMYRKSVHDPDIAPYMPDRRHLEWPLHLDVPTFEVYARMAWDLKTALDEAKASGKGFSIAAHYAGHRTIDEATPVGRIMSVHMAMEMLLDHPDLLVDSATDYAEGKGKGSKYASMLYGTGALDELTHSPKLRHLIDKLRVVMADPASKVIIFTRYRWMQHLIADDCAFQGWEPAQYHGELSTAEQQAARARFLRNPECRVFVSTHAGERGTDLPVANWLVNYDSVWSSGQADQINGRHMRTSSEFENIFVADVFTEGTIEERKLELQGDKRKVARAIIDGEIDDVDRITNDAESLRKHVEAWLTEHDPGGMFLVAPE
jgi:SNF2 family DNA or RNA helicase